MPYNQSPLRTLLPCIQSHVHNTNTTKYCKVAKHTLAGQSIEMLPLQMSYTILFHHVEFQNKFCKTLFGYLNLLYK
jgi:hypothetical protein